MRVQLVCCLLHGDSVSCGAGLVTVCDSPSRTLWMITASFVCCSISHTPPSGLCLQFTNNPMLSDASGLPGYVVPVGGLVTQPGHFSCPSLSIVTSNGRLDVDPLYTNASHCVCDQVCDAQMCVHEGLRVRQGLVGGGGEGAMAPHFTWTQILSSAKQRIGSKCVCVG